MKDTVKQGGKKKKLNIVIAVINITYQFLKLKNLIKNILDMQLKKKIKKHL